MLVTSEKHIELGTIMRVVLPLDGGRRDIDAIARVVSVNRDEARRRPVYRAGCQFLNLGVQEEANIARFIYARQVELRRAGLL